MIYLIILAAIFVRLIPHMPNFAPVTALAIFSAANMDWKKSVGLVLVVRFISDIFLGFFAWPLMLAVYAAHLVGILFGLWIKNSPRPSLWKREGEAAVTPSFSKEGGGGVNYWTKVISSSLFASAIFFLATNFAFLYAGYPHNISGIMAAYANGLPFLRGTLLGDLGYTVGLFGAYEFAKFFAAFWRKSQVVSI